MEVFSTSSVTAYVYDKEHLLVLWFLERKKLYLD